MIRVDNGFAAFLAFCLPAIASSGQIAGELPVPLLSRIGALESLAKPEVAAECGALLKVVDDPNVYHARARARGLDLVRNACWKLLPWTHPTLVAVSESAVEVRRRLEEEEPAALATGLRYLGLNYHYLTQIERAVAHHQEGVSVAREWLGRGTGEDDLAASLEQLSWALMDLGDLEGGIEAARESERLFKRLIPPRPDMVVIALNARAHIEQQIDLRQAKDTWEEGLEICRTLGSEHRLLTGRIASNLGDACYRLGEFSDAITYLKEAEEHRSRDPKTGRPTRQLASTQHLLAQVFHDLGDYPQAIEYYSKSVDGFLDWLGPEPYRYAEALSGQATVLEESGLWKAARDKQFEALAIRERAVRDKDLDPAQEPDRTLKLLLARTLARFSTVQRRVADAGARASLERALVIQDSELGDLASSDRARTLLELAKLLQEDGQTRRAETLSDRCITELQELSEESPMLVEATEVAARLAPEVEDGMRLVRQGLRLSRKLYGEDNPRTVQLILTGAGLRRRQQQVAVALAEALAAQKLSLAHVAAVVYAFPRDQALAFAADRRRALDLAVELLAENRELYGNAGSVWEAVVANRTLVLDAEIERQRILRVAAKPDLAALAGRLIAARRRFAYLLVQTHGRTSHLAERLKAARIHLTEAEAALAKRTRSVLASNTQRHVSLGNLQRRLPHDTALVSVLRYRKTDGIGDAYLGLIAIGDDPPRPVPLGDAAAIDRSIREWRDAILNGGAGSSANRGRLGRSLRQRIWDPLADHMERPQTVLFVPDSMLHLVPLAALPSDQGRYLLEEGWSFHYLSSERDLLQDQTAWRTGPLLALGGIDYDHPPTRGGRPGTGAPAPASASVSSGRGHKTDCRVSLPHFFPSLPGSLAEIEDLAALWDRMGGAAPHGRRPVTLLTGAAATEDAFRSAVGGHRVVHLATHGIVSGAACPPREGQVRGIGGLSLGAVSTSATLPLSGLALTGANRRAAAGNSDQDGILTMEEILDLELDGVEWVVLSACDTGLGPHHPGEGVLGMRRAFQVAGAATLILSLWPVDDLATREWMRGLYEARFDRGLTTIESIKRASLEALERLRRRGDDNPAYWAAFVATGRWN